MIRIFAAAALIGLALGFAGSATAQRPGDGQAPRFQVDPWWPRPLPNNWLMGQAAGIAVDRHDHIWVIQRPRTLTEDERGATLNPPRSLCCAPAPPVLEFDQDGALVRSWGGPGAGYEWPLNEHGIFVDRSPPDPRQERVALSVLDDRRSGSSARDRSWTRSPSLARPYAGACTKGRTA